MSEEEHGHGDHEGHAHEGHAHAEPAAEKPIAKPIDFSRAIAGAKLIKPGARLAPAKPSAHVHDETCGHDHGDHEGHDHGDHEGHDHGDHEGHDHGPAPRSEPTSRAAETGGPAAQLPLSELLPGESDERGVFARYAQALLAIPGVTQVHLRSDGPTREVCAHFDEKAMSVAPLALQMRELADATVKRFQRATWFVRGMESAQCAMVVEHVLGRTAGVLTANVAYAAERLVVEFDTEAITKAGIEKRVEVIGYALEVPEPGHACSMHAHGGGLAPRLQMPLAFTAGGLLAAGWAIELFLDAPPWVPTAFYALALASGGFFPVRAALLSLRGRQLDVETLMVLAGAGAAALGAWFEGAFLLFLFSLGHAYEHRAMDRARRAIESLSTLRPKVARVRRGTSVVDVPVNKIQRGDRILVRPGDRVPLDGIVKDGESSFDEAPITGESMPVAKHLGDAVFAGSINGEAGVEIEVTKLSRDSVLSRIVDLVAQAETRKSATQRFAQRLERTFVPIVLVASIALPTVLYFFFDLSLRDSVLRGVSLLVAASPCALAISTPSAVLAAVAAAARGGVLVKGGAHLEALGAVRAIAFDKTGTLTHGAPALHEVSTLDGVDEAELLAVAAGAEGLSSHPLAKAILRGAAERKIAPRHAKDCVAVHGKGLRAQIDGKEVAVGSAALFEGAMLPEALVKTVAAMEERGRTAIVVRYGDRFLGALAVADTTRAEAPAVLRALAKLGIARTIMLSGDNLRVARAVANEIGLTEARAPLMPEGKVDAIRELAKEGGVAMIGDGVNDAPALAAASVGIAMGGAGSDAALETADIVLMGDAIDRLPFAVSLAREASMIIRQNVIIALGVSAVLVVASILGIGSISHAVVLHEGSTVVVVLNAMRLLSRRPAA
jgi:Cd2+/Zn2+-exporting ATPase